MIARKKNTEKLASWALVFVLFWGSSVFGSNEHEGWNFASGWTAELFLYHGLNRLKRFVSQITDKLYS